MLTNEQPPLYVSLNSYKCDSHQLYIYFVSYPLEIHVHLCQWRRANMDTLQLVDTMLR